MSVCTGRNHHQTKRRRRRTRCFFLLCGVGSEESGPSKGPVLRISFRRTLQGNEEDEEAIGPGSIFIDGAVVGAMTSEEFLAALGGFILHKAGDVEDREGDEELLRLGFDEDTFFLVVGRAVEEEAMDVDA